VQRRMFPYYSIHMETLTTGLDDRNFLSREGLCYLEFYKFFKKYRVKETLLLR